MKKKMTLNLMTLAILGLSVLFFGSSLHRLNMLSFKYELIVLLALVFIFLVMLKLSISTKRKSSKVIVRILNVLLSLALFFASFYTSRGIDAIKAITGANKKTYTMSVVVKNESSYQTISDLAEKNISVYMKSDTKNQNLAMEEIKQNVENVRFDIRESYKEMVDALYDGSADAILLNEAYRFMYEAENEKFSEETRILWSYEISEEMVDVRKSVNVVNTPFIVYISGIDTYGSISNVSRSDVNMIMTVNPNTKQILLTSIPRDAWVKLTNMDAYDKLTHSGLEGIENTVSTVENFLGININYYARVNFSSVVALVDAVGGIEVYSDRAFGNVSEGWNYFNGTEALGFARERHAYDDMYEDSERGDQRRVENQQAVMVATIKKLLSPTIITNYTDVLDAIEGMFETNLSSDEITDLVSMQLDDMAEWQFFNMKITGHYEYQYGGAYMPDWELIYYITDPESVKQCVESIKDVLNNKILK